jgi:hypothetical protein
MCNCGGKKASGMRGTSNAPRSLTRTPQVPTPTERRNQELEQLRKQTLQANSNRSEQERLRRLAVLRTLGHA